MTIKEAHTIPHYTSIFYIQYCDTNVWDASLKLSCTAHYIKDNTSALWIWLAKEIFRRLKTNWCQTYSKLQCEVLVR